MLLSPVYLSIFLESAVQLDKAEAARKLAVNAMEEARVGHTLWRHVGGGNWSAAASTSVPETAGLRPMDIQLKLQAGLLQVRMHMTRVMS